MDLRNVIDRLNDNTLLNEECFSINIEQLLDDRDEDPFDSNWVESYNKLKEVEIDGELKEIIDFIRELVFKKTYKLTGNGDLAAYISDDFELICINLARDRRNQFVNILWHSYENGEIPSK